MSARQVYISGKMVPEQDAKISIFDSAVMLGDTVTESTRTFRHQPFKLERHIERLYKSLKVTRIDAGHTPEEMLGISLEVLEANLPLLGEGDDCWLVHNISRGQSMAGADPTKQLSPATVMIFTMFLNLRDWAQFYTDGCHAVTAMSRAVPSQALDPRVKNRSRMAYTLAEAEVKLVDPQAQGILLDIYGNVAENKGANVFLVSEGEIRTPTTANALSGVSRETIFELAATEGIAVREMDLQVYDLYTADEIFFTSTPYCIMPATRFNGLPVGDGQVGPIVKRLLAAWSRLVEMDIVQQGRDQIAADGSK